MFKAFLTFWLPRDGIKAQLRTQAKALEFQIVKAEMASREAHFQLLSLRAQHVYLLEEIAREGVDTIPPGGDNVGVIPGATPGDHIPSY